MAHDVLVVEDEERVRLYSCETLRELGYKVVEARSAIAALQLIEAGHPVSLLFTDMVMPDMDGLDVLARLRAGGGLNVETPVIACTANVLPDQLEAYRRAGAAAVLAKPIDPRAMLEAVAAAA